MQAKALATSRAISSARVRPDRRRIATAVLFLLPAFVIYSLLVLFPVVQAAYYGFYKWNGLGPATDNVGWDNFNRVLHDSNFQTALRHNVLILVLSLLVQLPLALSLALIVGRQMRGRAVFRTIFFLPYVLSEVVAGVVWRFLYQPDSGLNQLIGNVYADWRPRSWLGDTNLVMYSLFVVITWKYIGFHIILYMAGLQNIPRELEEAAALDGAGPLRVIRDVTIPLLGPTVRLSAFLSVLGSLQFFDVIWVMTTGGPVGASETMATYMYRFGFQRFQLGYGAAVSLVIFLLCLAFALPYQRLVMRRDYEYSGTA